jgi:hypothetical protein
VSWDELGRVGTSWDIVLQRTFETMQPLADAVWQHSPYPPHAQQRRLFYSDQLDTYSTLVYRQGTHQGHAAAATQQEPDLQTYSVEGLNADLHCYLSVLVRRTRGFARSIGSLLDHCWITAALGVAVGLLLLCYNRRCLTLERAWHRLWPLLRANCASASSDEIAKQRQRLRRRLL